MTGLLVLSGAPTADLNAATKKYVDDHDALKLDKTLLVTAAGTAAQANHLIALDAAGKIPASALPVAGNMSFKGTADVTAAVPAGVASGNYYLAAANAVAGAGWTGIVGQSLKAGDALVYDGAAWHAMPQNVDLTGYLPLAGGTVTGAINLPAATPTVATQAVGKGYVDGEVAKKADTAHTHSYLPLAGGTVTGPIVLPAAAPTTDSQAANKKYVDDKVATVSAGGAADPATKTKAGIIRIATDTEVGVMTNDSVALTPKNLHIHQSAAKAWFWYDPSGGAGADLPATFNINARTHINVGQNQYHFVTLMNSPAYVVVAGNDGGGGGLFVGAVHQQKDGFYISTFNTKTQLAQDGGTQIAVVFGGI